MFKNSTFFRLALAVFVFLFQTLMSEIDLTRTERLWFNGDIPALKKEFANSVEDVGIYNLAYLEMLEGHYREAKIALSKLKKTNEAWYHLLMGELLYRQKNYANAVPHLQNAVDEFSDDLTALSYLGKAYIELEKYEEARIVLLKKLDDFDNNTISALVAESYIREKNTEMALKWLLRSKDIFPDMNTLWKLVRVYNSAGNSKKVLEYGVILATNFSDGIYTDRLKQIFRDNGLPAEALLVNKQEMTPLKLNLGEKLEYDVSYGFFHLGNLIIEITDTIKYAGRSCYVVEYYINSAKGIPFIDLHHSYQTYLDKETMLALKSIGITDNTNGINRAASIFDHKRQIMRTYLIFADGRIRYQEKPLPTGTVDSMSLLFYARQMVKNRVSGTVTTVIQGEYKTADIFYRKERELIEIIDKDYNAETVYAKANFTGLAGMTGNVWGWFIGDTKVPAIGKAQIFLGKVTLTLVGWKP